MRQIDTAMRPTLPQSTRKQKSATSSDCKPPAPNNPATTINIVRKKEASAKGVLPRQLAEQLIFKPFDDYGSNQIVGLGAKAIS